MVWHVGKRVNLSFAGELDGTIDNQLMWWYSRHLDSFKQLAWICVKVTRSTKQHPEGLIYACLDLVRNRQALLASIHSVHLKSDRNVMNEKRAIDHFSLLHCWLVTAWSGCECWIHFRKFQKLFSHPTSSSVCSFILNIVFQASYWTWEG